MPLSRLLGSLSDVPEFCNSAVLLSITKPICFLENLTIKEVIEEGVAPLAYPAGNTIYHPVKNFRHIPASHLFTWYSCSHRLSPRVRECFTVITSKVSCVMPCSWFWATISATILKISSQPATCIPTCSYLHKRQCLSITWATPPVILTLTLNQSQTHKFRR